LLSSLGRWQKGKDVYWYTRDVDRDKDAAAAELAMVKQREQDLMMEVGRKLLHSHQTAVAEWCCTLAPAYLPSAGLS
jgi:hypothetical protein